MLKAWITRTFLCASTRRASYRSARRAAMLVGALALLAACTSSSNFNVGDLIPGSQPAPPPAEPTTIGAGKVKVGLILPLSATGNAAAVGQSMKNAGEMALSEFNSPDIQLMVTDDGGTIAGAQAAAQQVLSQGAEIIIGPVFAQSVGAVAVAARPRGVPVIGFSTDSNIAGRGVYLLSFLPETDIDRVVSYAVSRGKRSFAALMPDNAYGTVIEAAFKQAVARHRGRLVVLERYPTDQSKWQAPIQRVAQAARQVDAILIADGADAVPAVAQQLVAGGVDIRRIQLLGTGLWDDPRLSTNAALQGAWYAAPDPAGFSSFSARYQAKYGQTPVRTATLSYDAVALVVALVKTQGAQRFTQQTLLSASGFSGIDGVFRFRSDGSNQRGLAVLEVTTSGPRIVSPAPRSFSRSGS